MSTIRVCKLPNRLGPLGFRSNPPKIPVVLPARSHVQERCDNDWPSGLAKDHFLLFGAGNGARHFEPRAGLQADHWRQPVRIRRCRVQPSSRATQNALSARTATP